MTEKEMLILMGKPVVVHKVLERIAGKCDRYWEATELDKSCPGWIVGFRWLLNGKVIPGQPCSSAWGFGVEEDNYEPPTFEETGSRTPCVLVTFWPTKKPVHVPMDGYKKVDLLEKPTLHPGRALK